MKRILIVLALICALALPGCSGCEKKEPKPAISKIEKQTKPIAKVKTIKPKPKKKPVKKATPTPSDPQTASKNKQRVLRIVPEVVKVFQSDEFRKRLQESAKTKDFRGFIQVLQSAMTDACKKEGLEFEQCMKMMNEFKDDQEVKNSLAKFRDAVDFKK